jgi:hypothetical protein
LKDIPKALLQAPNNPDRAGMSYANKFLEQTLFQTKQPFAVLGMKITLHQKAVVIP